MYEELKLPRMIKGLEQVFEQFPEHRTGKNTQYDLRDAGMGAFSVFFTQSPSFLAHQRDLKLRKGRSNAENLFGLRSIPSDNQIRNLLEPVSPTHLDCFYRQTFQALEQTGVLKSYRSFANQLLVAIDGTEYFSSKKIHCEQCSQRILKNGETNYFHSALTSVIVQPGNEHVISLEPEYIVPQDGHIRFSLCLERIMNVYQESKFPVIVRSQTLLGELLKIGLKIHNVKSDFTFRVTRTWLSVFYVPLISGIGRYLPYDFSHFRLAFVGSVQAAVLSSISWV